MGKNMETIMGNSSFHVLFLKEGCSFVVVLLKKRMLVSPSRQQFGGCYSHVIGTGSSLWELALKMPGGFGCHNSE